MTDGERMALLLRQARLVGTGFEAAWNAALTRIARNRGEDNERWRVQALAFRFAKPAWRRAYLGQPPERPEIVASMLWESFLAAADRSEMAAPTRSEPSFTELMEAA